MKLVIIPPGNEFCLNGYLLLLSMCIGAQLQIKQAEAELKCLA